MEQLELLLSIISQAAGNKQWVGQPRMAVLAIWRNASTLRRVYNARLNDLLVIDSNHYKYYRDADGAMATGNPGYFQQVNYVPEGYVLTSGDCNDNNIAINPGATEICDGVDNRDGVIDEVCPPIVFVNDIIVREGDNGFKNAVFTVWLKGKSANTVSLHYKTVEGTATAPEDYIVKIRHHHIRSQLSCSNNNGKGQGRQDKRTQRKFQAVAL